MSSSGIGNARTRPACRYHTSHGFHFPQFDDLTLDVFAFLDTLSANPLFKGSGGDLDFALPDGQLILMANFQDAKYYTQSKAMKDVYGGEVQGVGDEAFIGKVMGQESLLFRKGTQSVALSSFFDMKNGMKPHLNQQQLRRLAALILSRM